VWRRGEVPDDKSDREARRRATSTVHCTGLLRFQERAGPMTGGHRAESDARSDGESGYRRTHVDYIADEEVLGGRLVNRHPAYASGFSLVPHAFYDYATLLGITPYERLVYLHLFRRTQGAREVAFPSVPRLAGECGISERSVQRAVKGLVLAKRIGRTERRDRHGRPTSPIYDVSPLLRTLDALVQKRRGMVSAGHHDGVTQSPEVDKYGSRKEIKKFPIGRTSRAKNLEEQNREYLRRVHGV